MVPWFYRLCQCFLFCVFKVWNRFEIIGSEKIPHDPQGFILAPNHVSYLDPPVLGGGIKRPIVFLAKERLFKIRVLGRLIRMLGALPIAGQGELKTIRSVIRSLKSGNAVVIFPEGTRSVEGELQEAQAGVGFLARSANVPIVPCYIQGTREAWPKGGFKFLPAKIKVFIGDAIRINRSSSDDRDALYQSAADEVMKQIHDLRESALNSK